MAIPIPVTYTKIATTTWGIPITNEVNRLTTQSDSNTTRLTTAELKLPRGVRTVGKFGLSQAVGASDMQLSIPAGLLNTEANRLYEVTAVVGSLDVGTYPNLFIVYMKIGGVQMSPASHRQVAQQYSGFTHTWYFHSGPTGNEAMTIWARVANSTVTLGTTGVQAAMIDLGYSTAAKSAVFT